jgi:hypothetical protein
MMRAALLVLILCATGANLAMAEDRSVSSSVWQIDGSRFTLRSRARVRRRVRSRVSGNRPRL